MILRLSMLLFHSLENIQKLPIPMDNPQDTTSDWKNYTYELYSINEHVI